MSDSKIEWTNKTWNPVTGCVKVSPGCAHCYAETFMRRFHQGKPFLPSLAEVRLHLDRLQQPYRWRKPSLVFVNSMSDLFHEDVPDDFIRYVMEVIGKTPHHTYQILTKRSERMRDFMNANVPLPLRNLWLGVSVENARYKGRITDLLCTAAEVRFISFEPLLGDVGELNLYGFDWVIVGGESGETHLKRAMQPAWVRSVRDQAVEQRVAFFFKQWGTYRDGLRLGKTLTGRDLDGREWNEYPKERTA